MKIWRKRIAQLINDEAVYITAPATPGLLNTLCCTDLDQKLGIGYIGWIWPSCGVASGSAINGATTSSLNTLNLLCAPRILG